MRKNYSKDYHEFQSLTLIFDVTKERIISQLTQAQSLDSKANFILGSATALVSASLVIQAVLLTPHTSILINKFLESLPLLILLISYLLVMIMAFLAYKVNNYKGVANPEKLYEYYLDKPEDTTKADIFRVMVEAYKHNEKVIKKKGKFVNCSFFALGSEVFVLVIFIALSMLR